MPTRKLYEEELRKIDQDVERMGDLLEDSISMMMKALETTDTDLAREIIGRDGQINNLEKDIKQDCIYLIAKQQPIATDLRKIASVLRIIGDMERIADHCSDISEYILDLALKGNTPVPQAITPMLKVMQKMVDDSIMAFIERDDQKAAQVIEQDDAVDDYFYQILEELRDEMQENKNGIYQCTCYILIIKYIERMADHASNIAQWVIFIATGKLQ